MKTLMKSCLVVAMTAVLLINQAASAGTWTRSYTGAQGRTYIGTVTREGRGQYDYSNTLTRRNGQTVTRSDEVDCGRFACARSCTVTGPNGNSWNTYRGWWR